MKKIQSVLAVACLAVLAGCSSAPKSNEVTATYVPTSNYKDFTCEQLVAEAEGIRRSVPALASAVDKHRSNQDGVELVTWILFWPAAFALDKGSDTSGQLAKAKGELEAVTLAMQTKGCGQATQAGQQVAAAQPATAASASASPQGKDAFTVDQLAKATACRPKSSASLMASGAGFETYSVTCSSGDVSIYRCEFGNCRVLN